MIVPPLKGLNKCIPMTNPGLAPWALQEYRPKGLIAQPHQSIPQNNTITIKYKNTNATIHLHTPKHTSQSDNKPCKGNTLAKPRVE